MVVDDADENAIYAVLANSEEQYSLWRKGMTVPNGWKVVKEGTRTECCEYANAVWTDMRVLSRNRIDAIQAARW